MILLRDNNGESEAIEFYGIKRKDGESFFPDGSRHYQVREVDDGWGVFLVTVSKPERDDMLAAFASEQQAERFVLHLLGLDLPEPVNESGNWGNR